jgi:hypothetical protein
MTEIRYLPEVHNCQIEGNAVFKLTFLSRFAIIFVIGILTGCAGSKKMNVVPESTAKGETAMDDNTYVTLETSMGNMTLQLFPKVAPAHADSFVARTVDGFYDNTLFHRVVDNFMPQGTGEFV